MFSKQTYIQRRAELRRLMGSGLLVLPGNNESPANYPANAYKFRQDSTFLYFTGLKREGLALVIDVDNDREWLIGDDIDIDDIIWTGYVPSVSELAASVGIAQSAPMKELKTMIDASRAKGQQVHYLPPYRHDHMIQLGDLLGIHPLQTRAEASVPLIKAVVAMRSIKTDEEIPEIERAMAIGSRCTPPPCGPVPRASWSSTSQACSRASPISTAARCRSKPSSRPTAKSSTARRPCVRLRLGD